jgi:hypothetical protein
MFFSVGDGGGGVVVVVAVVVGVVVLGWLFPPPPQPAVSATITTIALAPATAGRRRAKRRELIEQSYLSSEYRFPDPRLHQTGTSCRKVRLRQQIRSKFARRPIQSG